jgi:hypothetical protein
MVNCVSAATVTVRLDVLVSHDFHHFIVNKNGRPILFFFPMQHSVASTQLDVSSAGRFLKFVEEDVC